MEAIDECRAIETAEADDRTRVGPHLEGIRNQ
jgi:cytochrome c2